MVSLNCLQCNNSILGRILQQSPERRPYVDFL
nr:MAG TPA: hypothetical protein [Caudoviricetes sp.]